MGKAGMKVTDQEAEALRLPSVSLPRYATLTHLTEQDKIVLFDQDELTYKLQQTIVGYFSDPSLIEGSEHTYWLTILKGRQTGSTNTCALSLLPFVQYTPGVTAAIAADTRNRADGLFERIELAYNNWPEQIRTDRKSKNETRRLTLKNESKVHVLSMETDDVGVGMSASAFVGSECPLWGDADGQISSLVPALINRKAARVILESTPQPLSAPSGQWWLDQWLESLSGKGRFRAAFFPFWDSKANRRPWNKNDHLTNAEIRLLERFGQTDRAGHPGLTLENLAFRREVMDTIQAIKRNPDLFAVWYPFDDQSCWISQGLGIVPNHAVARHLNKDLYDEKDDYNEFPETWDKPGPPKYEVNPDAVYLIGVDPAGFRSQDMSDDEGASTKHSNDHHAFQVLEVWDDEWIQVASYGAVADPNEFAELLYDVGMKFNKAKIVVERPGVGHATLALLRQMKYPNLHYDDKNKPGLHKGNQEEWLEKLVDGLMEKLTLRGKETTLQVRSYRHDKMTERTQKAELLRPGKDKTRRPRHHWDKVSALMVACMVAPRMPRRYKPTNEVDNVLPFAQITLNQHDAYLEAVRRKENPPRRKLQYRRKR